MELQSDGLANTSDDFILMEKLFLAVGNIEEGVKYRSFI